MIKVFLVFATVLAVAFYFLQDKLFTTPANATTAQFETLGKLPAQIKESSGIELSTKQGHYFTHNDANNKPNLYEINNKGKLVKTYTLKLPNVDWEDLARDDEGNLYIADTGNNSNKRNELAVYKVNLQSMQPTAIRFTYEDQPKKSSKKDKVGFDSEAIFWQNGQLYLITKDRNGSNEARIYQLPDEPGNHKARKIGAIKMKEPVTGAAISPDNTKIVLLSEEKIHLFRDAQSAEALLNEKAEEINLNGAGQTEGITFEDDNTLILTSEGGNLYRYKL